MAMQSAFSSSILPTPFTFPFVFIITLGTTPPTTKAYTKNGNKTVITLGQGIDYPPYAYATPGGELAGFGKDMADGMNELCPDIEIVVVEEKWANCWTDDDGGSLGPSLDNNSDGTTNANVTSLDGCMTYTHTHGVRDELAEFSYAIVNDNKPAGLLTLLDSNGIPQVTGMDDLNNKTIIDVGGWAPTPDGLDQVLNECTNEHYSRHYKLVIAEGDFPNDVAMKMLRDGEGDAIFIHSDAAKEYSQCSEDEATAIWNCTLWKGFGTEYAYVQSGQFDYIINGTTLSISKKGSGVRELLGPCIVEYMATKEYYDICVKHDITSNCYRNKYFPNSNAGWPIEDMPTNEHVGKDCSSGFCPCDVGVKSENGDHSDVEGGGGSSDVGNGVKKFGRSLSVSSGVWIFFILGQSFVR